MQRMVYMIVPMILVPVVIVILLAILSATAHRPEHLGVRNGRLADCPDAPNCVSTQAIDARHQIAPLPLTGEPAEALSRLKRALAHLPRTKIVAETNDYLHVEATSWLFHFVDDIECFVDSVHRVIHVRSASRVGHSDFGVNRARVESVRKAYEEITAQTTNQS